MGTNLIPSANPESIVRAYLNFFKDFLQSGSEHIGAWVRVYKMSGWKNYTVTPVPYS